MKKFNDLKIYIKMSLVIGLAVTVGLGIIYGVINTRTRSIMREQTEVRLAELTEARGKVVETYFSNFSNYVLGFSKLPEVSEFMQNPSDKKLQSTVQSSLEYYAATWPGMESMYLGDDDTLVLAHTDPSFNGQIANAEMAGFTTTIEEMGGIFNVGVVLSPATNSNVAMVFVNVYDPSGKPVGFVGCATYIDNLQNTVSGMSSEGLNDMQEYLIGLSGSTYVFAPDPSLLGAEVTDEAQLSALATIAEKPDAMGAFDYKDPVYGKSVLSYRSLPSVNLAFIVTDPHKDFMKDINNLSNSILIMTVIVLIISLIAVICISKAISADIEEVSDVITELGTLDITQTAALSVYEGRKDEVGVIANATKTLSEAVGDTIRSLRKLSGNLQEGSGKLKENSITTLDTIGQVDVAVHGIAKSATSQSMETRNATESVKEIGMMVEETKGKAKMLKDASRSMQDSSVKAGDILKELGEVNEKTKIAVDAMYEQTTQTSHSADQIAKASELIASIATQTNLLSLNASIEAARAGDAGKGFAVVAGEIGSLASQTADTTKEINDIIQQLIDNSKRSTEAMDEVRNIIDKQNEYVQQTKTIFGSVEGEIVNSLESIDEISSTVERLDKVRGEVVGMVEALSSIAETNAATTQQTSASTSVVSNMMEQVSVIASEISDIADGVQKDIDAFKISE